MWDVRIAGLLDRSDLSRRLRWNGSDLQEISPERILELEILEMARGEEIVGIPCNGIPVGLDAPISPDADTGEEHLVDVVTITSGGHGRQPT